MRILIFVVAYNAEKQISETLDRIPLDWLSSIDYEILIINDASTDQTQRVVDQYVLTHPGLNIRALLNDFNLGYGGNQKKGYDYAFENKYDLVVLLHGDGQYAPEYLSKMTDQIIHNKADVVLGSRMIHKMDALKGKMPLYKWMGNQVLTVLQNSVLGTSFSEFHTGYRAFRLSALMAIPLDENSDYFDFDTEIIIQLVDTRARFAEISIPTFYGDEISYVNGFKYAWLIMKATLISRLVKRKWMKDKRFSYSNNQL